MQRQTNKEALISELNPLSTVSESFRALRTHLQFINDDEAPKVITAASAAPGEGKTTVLVNLAISYSQEGKRVALVDGDLRRPTLHEVFKTSNSTGLSNYLHQKYELSEVIKETNIEHVHLISSGPIPSNPAELIGSKRMDTLLEELRSEFDMILIDSPPVLAVADSKLIASKCDGVILVVHAIKSKRELTKKAKEQLEAVKACILGVVLNGKKQTDSNSAYGYYGQAK